MLGRLVCSAALLLFVACNETGAPPAVVRDGGNPFVAPSYSARRPVHTYYLGNDDGRCAVYRVNGTKRVRLDNVRCPREVAAGQRIRLAGRTCFLEGTDAAPPPLTRCPTELYRAEYRNRDK